MGLSEVSHPQNEHLSPKSGPLLHKYTEMLIGAGLETRCP